MLKRYMHKRERHLAMLNDDRQVRSFEWGTEFVGGDRDTEDPHAFFSEFSRRTIENSDQYFSIPKSFDFSVNESDAVMVTGGPSDPGSRNADFGFQPPGTTNPQSQIRNPQSAAPGSDPRLQLLTWSSSVTTPSAENNTARATYFPHETNRKAAVIILPHWNAKAGSYFDLCRFFNKVGISALRLTLPYHEERMPPELTRADYLVAPNVGRSLQSITQAVADTRAGIVWLKQQGYEKIGVVGTSIGSCVAFLAFVHDPSIIYADEPTGNLDAKTGTGIVELLLDLVRAHGTTLVVVTHDTQLATRGDRQLEIREGLLVV